MDPKSEAGDNPVEEQRDQEHQSSQPIPMDTATSGTKDDENSDEVP